jgi:phospholipase/lecithinase/hemolysin
MVLNVRSTATSALLLVLAFSFTTFQTVHADGFAGTLTTLVTFGDSYSVQNVGDGRVQWPDWAAGYLDLKLFDYARSGATCSNALTPRAYPAVTEDELPAYWNDASNGTLGDIDYSTTLYSIWIGTNDVGAGCLLTGDQTPGVSIIDTTYCVIQWMRSLYEQGARNFIVQNVSPFHIDQSTFSEDESPCPVADGSPPTSTDVSKRRVSDKILDTRQKCN